MKKPLLHVALICFFLFLASIVGGISKQACARYYGPGDTCPLHGDTVGSIYPNGTSSVDINFWITINGTPPPGTSAWVQAGTSQNDTCGGELKCLTRYDEASVPATTGLHTTKLDKIGCSDSGCRIGGVDLIPVSAYLYPAPPSSAGCSTAIISSDPGIMQGTQLDITNANGQSRPVYVSFTCTPPILTSTPTPTPSACVVPAKPVPVMTCAGCTK